MAFGCQCTVKPTMTAIMHAGRFVGRQQPYKTEHVVCEVHPGNFLKHSICGKDLSRLEMVTMRTGESPLERANLGACCRRILTSVPVVREKKPRVRSPKLTREEEKKPNDNARELHTIWGSPSR